MNFSGCLDLSIRFNRYGVYNGNKLRAGHNLKEFAQALTIVWTPIEQCWNKFRVVKITVIYPLNTSSRGKSKEFTDILIECLSIPLELQIEGYEILKVGAGPITLVCNQL
jgi:hypothetical protein